MERIIGINQSLFVSHSIPTKNKASLLASLSEKQFKELMQQVSKTIQRSLKKADVDAFIPVFYKEEYVLVKQNEIIRLEAERAYTRIITVHKEFLSCKRIGYYEEELSTDRFFRCHKSHIINLSKIVRIRKGSSRYLILQDESVLPISHSKSMLLNEIFNL